MSESYNWLFRQRSNYINKLKENVKCKHIDMPELYQLI